MMRIIFIFVALMASLSSEDLLFSTELKWEINFETALQRSEKENKHLLLFFTGSDWSGLGMKMKNEIFSTPEFQKKVFETFVCIEVDFPRYKNVAMENVKQNSFLKAKFKVEEFPTILLIDSKEREIARLSYLPENGVKFGEDLTRIVRQDKELNEGLIDHKGDPILLRKLYQLAEDLQRKPALEMILNEGVKANDSFFLLEKYRLLVERKDENASEIKKKLVNMQSCEIDFTLALIDFQELAKDRSTCEGALIAIRPLEEYLDKHRAADIEKMWRIEMMIAETFLEIDDWNKALLHAEKAHNNCPDNRKEEIGHLILYIQDKKNEPNGSQHAFKKHMHLEPMDLS